MADGKTHEQYLRIFWKPVIIASGLSFILTWDAYFPAFILLNFGITEFLSPDLDHFSQNRDETDAKAMSRKVSLALLLSRKKYKKNSKLRKFLAKFNLGLLGAIYLGWTEVYEYFGWTFGGHRSWFSHGWVIGTITLMIWFNLPLAWIMYSLVSYAITTWGHPSWEVVGWNYFYMKDWLPIYLGTQFVVWNFTNGVHLVLDTEWAKGRLYGFKKYDDKRGLLLKKISNLILIN